MNKLLALFSSNDFSIAENEFKKILNENTKILCFSGADYNWQINNPKELQQGGKYYKEQYEPFKDFSVTEDHFYIVHPKDDKETIKSRFTYCDVIFLAGGHMCVLEQLLNNFGLWKLIKMCDKHIIGVSAGALLQLDKYDITPYIDKDYDYYEECYGLGLIKNLRLIVHYHDDYDKHQEILDYLTDKIVDEMYDTNKDIMLIALSDNEGIIIDDEKDFKLKIFGRDDQNE